MGRVQFQAPEQAVRNDRWKSSRGEHWVKTGLPLMALSGDNRVMNAPDCSDPLVIAGKRYHSRLLTGTGKFTDMDETARASEAAGAQIVTFAVRRANLGQEPGKPTLLDALPQNRSTNRKSTRL